MKTTLKIIILALIGWWMAVPALYAQIKEKKISYARCAYYYGPTEKRTPKGDGKLTINEDYTTTITVTGTFDGANVSNAVVEFVSQGVTFKGNIVYEKTRDITVPLIRIHMSEGRLYHKEKLLGEIKKEPFEVILDCSWGFASMIRSSGKLYTIQKSRHSFLNAAKGFAECDEYEIENHDIIPFQLRENITFGKANTAVEPLTLLFANGTVTPLEPLRTGMKWTKPNGDFVNFNNNGRITEYNITLSSGRINGNTVTHKFSNGNVFEGKVRDRLVPNISLEWLTNTRHILWPWEKFCEFAKRGKITFADGASFSGEFSSNGFTVGDKLDDSSYYEGAMYDSTGAQIDDYQYGQNRAQRDSIERARIAEEDARQAEEAALEQRMKAREAEEQQKKIELYKKYGKKYVDSIIDSKGTIIPVGTPLALLNEFDDWKGLLGVYLILKLRTDSGNEQSYKWWTPYHNADTGYFGTINGKVSSVTYYY